MGIDQKRQDFGFSGVGRESVVTVLGLCIGRGKGGREELSR